MAKSSLDSSGTPEEYWFNLKTGQVEFGRLAPATYRVGPFTTQLEAQNALQRIAERSKLWASEEEDED